MSIKRPVVILLDGMAIIAGLFFAFLLRYGPPMTPENYRLFSSSMPLIMFGYFCAFGYFKLYAGIWRYSSFSDLVRIVEAVAVGFVFNSALILLIYHGRYPRSVLVISSVLTFLCICAIRFIIRFVKDYFYAASARSIKPSALIVGAGDMGENLLRQIQQSNPVAYDVVGFIDDDPAKIGLAIHGVPILGAIGDLPSILGRRNIHEIIISVNSRRGDVVSAVTSALRMAGSNAELKIAPSLDEMLQKPGSGLIVRKVRPADLLNRQVIQLDEVRIARFITGKTIMVTGAGGTIGAELCRQALRYGPSKLILLDSHSTSLFYCDAELRKRNSKTEISSVLSSVCDRSSMERIISRHQPKVILHAAAHKHQPQLESNVHESVRNNFLATFHLAEACHRHRAECFLLISTDKAVNPSSVMGASKRAAEMAIHALARQSETRFIAVRFGNVLGSSGSVLKIFQEQIEQGGPITLTHADMERYFMTVEEAVQLILQACAMARGGETFTLKMGSPVRILDMARKLILLNGLEPDKDIRIQYVGLRPGEKLREELLEEPGEALESEHPQILLHKSPHNEIKMIEKYVREFHELCEEGSEADIFEMLGKMIPSFRRCDGGLFPGK